LSRPTLSFDGCGINGPDEYRSRIATFTNYDFAATYGHQLAAAPELLKACSEFIAFGKAGGDTSWHSKAAQDFFYAMMVAIGHAEGKP
jgi:hypothetical protein